ncbi:hypothetical protein DL770_010966 [Monosporascus sp. CRB-9-2]|nr:hypothetical protein DL770_010966 [Monosporascus sp. CRB-9-2]
MAVIISSWEYSFQNKFFAHPDCYGWREDKTNGFPECEFQVKRVKKAVVSDKFVDSAEDESDNNEENDDDGTDSNEFVSLSDLERDEDEEPQQQQQQQADHGISIPSGWIYDIKAAPRDPVLVITICLKPDAVKIESIRKEFVSPSVIRTLAGKNWLDSAPSSGSCFYWRVPDGQ